jgi:hypothetical protein
MMNLSSARTIFKFSLMTAASLGGCLVVGFLSANLLFESANVHLSGFLSGLLGFLFLLSFLFGGGAVWGWGVARLMKADSRSLARGGGLTFGTSVLLVGIALELANGLVGAIASILPLPIHVGFMLVFVPSAGLIAGLNAHKMTGRLGLDQLKKAVGVNTGITASMAFLVVSLVMLAFGWRVGAPGAEARFTMIRVMLTSNLGAALAGGAAMGWILIRYRETSSTRLTSPEAGLVGTRVDAAPYDETRKAA